MNMLREHRDIAPQTCAWQLLGRRYRSAHKQVIPQYSDRDQEWVKCLRHTIRVRGSIEYTPGAQVCILETQKRERSPLACHPTWIGTLCGSRIARHAPYDVQHLLRKGARVAGSRCFVPTCRSGDKPESSTVGGSVSAEEVEGWPRMRWAMVVQLGQRRGFV